MRIPGDASSSELIVPERSVAPALPSAQTLDDPRQPHCADHPHFTASCPVCKQACANMQPYPIKRSDPPSRSFGMTGNITPATFPQPTYTGYNTSLNSYSGLDPETDLEVSLSLIIIRIILRLIWPFSRIL
jgi:hypothetical protein